ncbi:MAG TPA: MFS transporter [Casimicrobiaceae bacterium]
MRITMRGELASLSLAAFASMMSMRICDPLLPALARQFATTTGVAAQVISAFAIAYGVLQLAYGPLADRYGKFRIVSIAVVGCAAANAAAAFAPSLDLLVASRAAAGGTAAAVIPLTMAWIGDAVPYAQRQEALARLLGATVLGMIAGQWSGGLLADTLGWRSVFIVLAVLFVAVAIVMRATSRDVAATATQARGDTAGYWTRIRGVLATPWAREVLALAFIEGAIGYSAFAFVPSHLHARFGLAMTWAGAVLALYGVGGFAYSRLARTLLRRLGEAGLARAGGLLLGVAFAVLAAMPDWRFAIPACLLGGLAMYMLHNTLQTHATQMVPKARGTAVSLFACTLFLGQSLGVAGASFIVDHASARVAFVIAALTLPLLAAWFAHRIASAGPRNRGAHAVE